MGQALLAAMGWEEAVLPAPQGVRLLLEVAPGASADAFPDGYNPWRRRIGVRVRAPARQGEANAAVVRLVAARLGVAAACVQVVAGAWDARKDVLVAGATPQHCLERLRGARPP